MLSVDCWARQTRAQEATQRMQAGDQVGEYRLVRELGRGTFGVVYQAQHLHLRRQAAIKALLTTTPQEYAALVEEANKIAEWNHPNIVKVLGFSLHQNQPYV